MKTHVISVHEPINFEIVGVSNNCRDCLLPAHH